MKTLSLVTILWLLPALAGAVICKTIAPDGTVSYSDLPAAECPHPVDLPDYSRYAPRVPAPETPPASPATGSLPADFDGYESARIVQPARDGTVRNNEGIVPVVVISEPALQPGHGIEITLDGRKVEGRFGGAAVVLSGVERGVHTLRASIHDALGASLIQTAPVRFTLRKSGLFDRPADAEPPVEPVPPVAPAPPDFSPPAGGADYRPPGPPDYQPPTGPSGATPGRTNPAFAPGYGR